MVWGDTAGCGPENVVNMACGLPPPTIQVRLVNTQNLTNPTTGALTYINGRLEVSVCWGALTECRRCRQVLLMEQGASEHLRCILFPFLQVAYNGTWGTVCECFSGWKGSILSECIWQGIATLGALTPVAALAPVLQARKALRSEGF